MRYFTKPFTFEAALATNGESETIDVQHLTDKAVSFNRIDGVALNGTYRVLISLDGEHFVPGAEDVTGTAVEANGGAGLSIEPACKKVKIKCMTHTAGAMIVNLSGNDHRSE